MFDGKTHPAGGLDNVIASKKKENKRMEKVKVFNLQKWHAMFSIFLGFFYKSP